MFDLGDQPLGQRRDVGHIIKLRVAGKTLLRLIGLFKPRVRESTELQKLIGTIRKTAYVEGLPQTLAAAVI